ncbi:hypothetical protein D9611_008299 [Ephemerocybe angulata]|uniref:Uncharacterized protein n=1 Tax=Ephemerocybe angulata TaxID=980116 RepID=A0A8H5BIQ5_9AGAR|nr:hypothetical protein D9611_008299 [Tulosesus angulatus]
MKLPPSGWIREKDMGSTRGREGARSTNKSRPPVETAINGTRKWWEMGHAPSAVKVLLAAPGINVNAVDTSGWTALTWAAFNGREDIVQNLCAVPEIIVDVADVKRRFEDPPEGWRWGSPASKDVQDKCVRILEEFVESKGGRAKGGTEQSSGG